ncbi:unnamed protein product, partial [Polarella glacialis]
MEVANQWFLTSRFLSAGLLIALTWNVLKSSGDHVLQALPPVCVSAALKMPAACRQGSCAAVPDLLTPSCRRSWQALEVAFTTELHIAFALLVIELVSILTAIHSANGEALNFLVAVLHSAGCV